MSEPEPMAWLDDIAAELRSEVPVRSEWRARLLDEVARAPGPMRASTRGHLVVRPLVGLAAALLFAALGAGVALGVVAWHDRSAVTGGRSMAVGQPPAAASPGEPVRFVLEAPQASRVSLVGSFNHWNPAATPLVRDSATGDWTVTLRLPPGRHVYAFVVDGDVRTDPAAPRTADDDFGAPNSVILVAGPAS